MRVDSLIQPQAVVLPGPSPTVTRSGSFQELLQSALGDVNSKQAGAEQMIQQVMSGQEIDTSEVANAITKADLAFRTMIQVRNRLVQAFNELRQMQV